MKFLLTISATTLLLLLSCNSNKKVVQHSEASKDSICTAISYRLERFAVDTTKISDWHITISEEEYYPATATTSASVKRKTTKTIRHKSERKGVTQTADSVAGETQTMLKNNAIKHIQEQTKSVFSIPWWVWVCVSFGIYIILLFVMRKIANK